VKGRIQTRVIQGEDGTKKKRTEIIAERVTFLAQSPTNKEDKKSSKSEKKDKK
jgi:single-stranded DNA-binding protein